MRILLINYEYPPLGGGAGTVSHHIARDLVAQGHRVDTVTMGYRGLPAVQEEDGVTVYRVPGLRRHKEYSSPHEMIFYVLSAARFLDLHLRDHHYDLCHCHFIVPTGVLAWWLKRRYGLPYVITAHGSDVPGYNGDRFGWFHRFSPPLLRTVARGSEALVSPSLHLLRMMRENIGELPLRHLPNGIRLQPDPVEQGIPKKPIVLATGRLLPRKGYQTLIRAVHDRGLPCEVHIAGDGPFRRPLEELARGSRTPIVFHGWLEKESETLRRLYEEASIYVLLSRSENASIALLEAMMYRAAIITSNVTGCPETVGDAGLLLECDDVEGLGRVLEELCDDRRRLEEMARRARRRVEEHYDIVQVARRYGVLFEELLDGGGSGRS